MPLEIKPGGTIRQTGKPLLLTCIILWMLIPFAAFAQTTIRVSTTEELVAGIASDTTIILEAGEYYLSEAEGIYTQHVAWEDVFDGEQLLIHDVENLTIMSEQGATILSEPRYSYVLSFLNSTGINLDYLALAHTEAGYCVGGVVRLQRCRQVRMRSCGLFGSGTVGIDIIDSHGLRVWDSSIGECTYGAVWIRTSSDVIFADVEISGNEAWPLIDIGESTGIVFDYCRIGYNYGEALFSIDHDSSNVLFEAVSFEENECDYLAHEGTQLPELSNCAFSDNYFADQAINEDE